MFRIKGCARGVEVRHKRERTLSQIGSDTEALDVGAENIIYICCRSQYAECRLLATYGYIMCVDKYLYQ